MAITVFDEAAGSATTTSGPSWEIKIFYNYSLKREIARKNLGRKTRQIETVTYVLVQNHVNLTRYFFNFFSKLGEPYLCRIFFVGGESLKNTKG